MLKYNILFCTIVIYYFFFSFLDHIARWARLRIKKKKILISSEINRSLCPAKLKPTHHHQSSTSHVIVQKTVFSFNPYIELSFPTFNLRYETQPRPSIWLEFSRISGAHSLSIMPIPIAMRIILRFSARIATFNDFAISMNHLVFFHLRSPFSRSGSKRISEFLSDKIFPRSTFSFPLLRLIFFCMEEGTIKEEKKEDGILYFIAYKYDNVVLASHPVHRCTIVKEYRCNSTNT